MDGQCKFVIVSVVSQMDGWIYSVSLRYSLIVCVVSQIDR